MGQLCQLRKHVAMLDASSISKMKQIFDSGDMPSYEGMLRTLFAHTEDTIQLLLISEICKLKGIVLDEEIDTPPLMVG